MVALAGVTLVLLTGRYRVGPLYSQVNFSKYQYISKAAKAISWRHIPFRTAPWGASIRPCTVHMAALLRYLCLALQIGFRVGIG